MDMDDIRVTASRPARKTVEQLTLLHHIRAID
jgi:hypothetical protein